MLKLSAFIALAGLLLLIHTGNLFGYSKRITARINWLSGKIRLGSNENSELQYYKINKIIACVGWVALALGGAAFAISYVSAVKASESSSSQELSDSQVHPDVKRQKSICPSQDFSIFLGVFAESVDAQRDFTTYPLELQHLELGVDPDPKSVIRRLQRNNVSFPVIPGAAERRLKSLVFRTENVGDSIVKLLLMKAGTDFQVVYLFRKDSCWSLYRIEDWSL